MTKGKTNSSARASVYSWLLFRLIGLVLSYFVLITLGACKDIKSNEQDKVEEEQSAIRAVLNEETRAFCDRDFNSWKLCWYHSDQTSKLYAGDVAFEELIGWPAINAFAEQHWEQYPDTIPLAPLEQKLHVELLSEEIAFVTYSKQLSEGFARELRFMRKQDKEWKIFRMETLYRIQ